MMKPFVVAISSVSGGGKTTVINNLLGIIDESEAIYFDDYDFDGPDDICEWVARGSEYKEWKLVPMVDDVNKIITEKKNNAKWLFLDYPFAYVHEEMKGYIDLAIFIDTPLDIAMARRILRDYNNNTDNNINNDLRNYLLQGRKAYLEMLKTIKPNCDVVIDGTETIESISMRVLANL